MRPRLLALILVLAGLCLPLFTHASSPPAKEQTVNNPAKDSPLIPRRYLPAMPTSMTLCGEPVPLNLPFVAEMLDREFNIAVHEQAQVVMWLKRGARYFPYISKKLKEAGLPDDLKYLAVAESSLIRGVRSWAGAVGLWQFMSDTGKRYGLRRDHWFDDRRNPEKATAAAVAYLKDLYKHFGSWPLAMAAYNCGEKRIQREIKEQGIKDYYQLYLPDETMRYVFRVLAAKIIMQNPERYGYHLPAEQLYRPVASDTVTLSLKRPLHLRSLAQAAGTTVRELMELNPEIKNYFLPAGNHAIKVPPGKAKGLSSRLAGMKPDPLPPAGEWTVKPGETLSGIAKKNGLKIDDLRKANNLKGTLIKPGQKLVIPVK